MKTEIAIPDALVVAAEAYARAHGLSRDDVFARAVAEYLAGDRYEGVTATLNAIYTDEPSGLEPALRAAQARALPREDW